ncbi:MAG: TusE/DsrC/DsvC family sulfur relay protein [Planctomycetota bacterium]
MLHDGTKLQGEGLDGEGYLKEMASWTRERAEELAVANEIGPLTDDHWRVIEFIQEYYRTYGTGPAVVRIGKATGLSAQRICDLFPCGVVKGAYRLAGLPRPPGCV